MKPTVLKPIRQALMLGVITTTLAGCQLLGPMYSRPESTLPAQFDSHPGMATSAEQQMALQKWWTLFNDSALNSLVETALEKNTNVQLAVARIEEADAQAREIGANILPSVTLDGSGVRNRVTESGIFPVFGDNPRKTYKIGLNSSVELDFWGKLRRANESARASLLSTNYAKEAVYSSTSSLVVNHYVMIRSLDAQLDVNAENLRTAQDSLDLARRRVEGGVATILDAHQAELVVTTLQSQKLDLERLRALSEHQLGFLTNDLGLRVAKVDRASLPVAPIVPAGLPSELMEARPDVRQAEQTLVAANANIGVAKANLYPSISLTAAYGGESIALNNLLNAPARVWSLGTALTLPIFDGGRLKARVAQANAKQKQAVISYQTAVQTAFTEVNDALVSTRQYRAQETVAESKQQTTANILQISQNRYQAGYSGYLEVLDAQRNHNEATQAFVQSRQNTLTATISLFKALGGGWNPETLKEKSAAAK
jgi:outer membrane protein, multidrug efflux system